LLRVPKECRRVLRSRRPCGRRDRRPKRAADHSGPPPSGIRSPHFVPRCSRFRSIPRGTRATRVQARQARCCRGSRSPASPSAARAKGWGVRQPRRRLRSGNLGVSSPPLPWGRNYGSTEPLSKGRTKLHPTRRSASRRWTAAMGQGPTKSPIVCLALDSRHWGLKISASSPRP
jgi:hypothetical protein